MFNSSELKEMATVSGLGEKAVQRLLGGIRLEFATNVDPTDVEALAKRPVVGFEIGLRLARPELLMGMAKQERLRLLGELLREYRTACPVVTAWAGRGDFDPTKISESITRGVALHASRTAGRLRAKALRKVTSSF